MRLSARLTFGLLKLPVGRVVDKQDGWRFSMAMSLLTTSWTPKKGQLRHPLEVLQACLGSLRTCGSLLQRHPSSCRSATTAKACMCGVNLIARQESSCGVQEKIDFVKRDFQYCWRSTLNRDNFDSEMYFEDPISKFINYTGDCR